MDSSRLLKLVGQELSGEMVTDEPAAGLSFQRKGSRVFSSFPCISLLFSAFVLNRMTELLLRYSTKVTCFS